MHEAEREAQVRRYWQGLWSDGDVALAHEFYAERFELNGRELGAADFANGAASWRAYFSGFEASVAELFSCDHRVISRVVYRGRHVVDFETVPAAGAAFEASGIDIFEFEGDRVVRHWHETDHWKLYEQLGAEPRPKAVE